MSWTKYGNNQGRVPGQEGWGPCVKVRWSNKSDGRRQAQSGHTEARGREWGPVEVRGDVWGLVEGWEAQGLTPRCKEVRRQPGGQVEAAWKACGEAEVGECWDRGRSLLFQWE